MSDELRSLQDRVHSGITTFDLEGKEAPCIVFDGKRFDSIMQEVAGQPLSVNTDMNILQDGMGHVFVEIVLTFSKGDFVDKILINASESLKFFELLAEVSILVISSPASTFGQDRVFMIQLPRPDKAIDALEIIRNGLKSGGGGGSEEWT